MKAVGFDEISIDRDITENLWDDKEKLLFGNTPMFMIRGINGADHLIEVKQPPVIAIDGKLYTDVTPEMAENLVEEIM